MKRQIFIDTETTGFSASQGHRIVELAAVEAIAGKLTGRVFHTYLDPERPIDPGAERVHGITAGMLRGKPLFSSIAGELVEFLKDAECLMHNAPFDSAFIDAELERVGIAYRLSDLGKVSCTMQLARSCFPGESATLDALILRAGLPAQRQKHSALEDAKLLAQVYFTLLNPKRHPATKGAAASPNIMSEQPISRMMFPAMLGMEKVIELVKARTETFFYRDKHKRIIDHRVVDERRWKRVAGPLLYAVTDAAGAMRYIGKWESASALYSRWVRHDTIHHQERARNLYIAELDAGRGPLAVWSISVRELKPKLPAPMQAMSDKLLAASLEALWIQRWQSQLAWNERKEAVPTGFSDGEFWK